MASIVARAPLRIALGGGGTDLPSHYREHGGFVVSTAIDRYVHIVVSTDLQPRFRLKHLEWEDVEDPADVRHPILREVLARHWAGGGMELASVGDAPPGTGLGSSGAYTVCAIRALQAAAGHGPDRGELAEAACEIEIDVLGRQVGKQDQYAASFGGLRSYSFNPDDSVDVGELDVPERVRDALRDDFLLFFTGQERSASDVLSGQVSGTRAGDASVRRALERLHELGRATCSAMEAGDLAKCAELLNEQWEAKRGRAPGTVTDEMDALRDRALRAGGLGAVPLGAGGGGFVLVYTPDPERTRGELTDVPELSFAPDSGGCVAHARPFGMAGQQG
ncbi:MAG: galactokinase [Thermoleophilaceae bacterium]|nr:galactokinase [Thermoleophilaceae bacterium]